MKSVDGTFSVKWASERLARLYLPAAPISMSTIGVGLSAETLRGGKEKGRVTFFGTRRTLCLGNPQSG